MVVLSRLIIGIVLVFLGVLMFSTSFFNLGSVIGGSIIVIFGIVILLNKGEDKIERRKDKK